MVTSILATKLYIPPSSQNYVLRQRLVDRLNQGLDRKLTLVSAPAGFGKTALVSEWAKCCGHNEPAAPGETPIRTAWLSLDDQDSDPVRFLSYLVAALQMVVPGLSEGIQGILRSSQPPIEPILVAMINDITTVTGKIILVLDDYHMIDSVKVDEAIAYLIDHLPPLMHLVITTREDPQLPLARLRARGQMTELRVSDLRFTPDEAVDFFAGMGIKLLPEEITALEERTEGWIAGLQLAALAIQSGPDVPAFIRDFSGDHRYIMDYLVEEVLRRQPEPVRRFLLQTSILDRLHGPLCNAVTGQTDGSTQLENLEHGNFFIISLDDQRRWYRYHHLFADVLMAHLKTEQPDQVPTLHRRASIWYEQQGAFADAIRHALAADDFARAADKIEQVFPAMSRTRQELTLLGWLRALPEALVHNRPVLCNLYAGTLMQIGEIQQVEDWLLTAEQWLDLYQDGLERLGENSVVVNQEEFRRLPGAVALHRAGQALMLGRVDEAMRHARRVLDLAPEDDFLRRGGAGAILGLSFWALGDLAAARQVYPDSILNLRRVGYLSDATGCSLALADIAITQGHLREAMSIYDQALRFASERGEPNLRGTADMLVGMSELHYEYNELATAAQYLMKAKEQGEHTGLPQNRYRWRVATARIRQADGDVNGALELLNEAERVYAGDFTPNVRPVPAIRARLQAERGLLEEAFGWARAQQLTPEDDFSYLHEYEHITRARIHLACCRRDREHSVIQEALSQLDRLLQSAEAGGRVKSIIEIRILQALFQQELGDRSAALKLIQHALTLAEPEGYMRIFLDEGPPVEHLLREALLHRANPGYIRRLLAGFDAGGAQQTGEVSNSTTASISSAPITLEAQSATLALVEPLSQRELDVLRLFKTELSGPEIAQELMIALSTVRTYTKSIYSKLDVNNRRAAVRRAAELNLI